MLRLIVSLDFSECSRLALQHAWQIALRASPVELIVLNVVPRHADGASAVAEIESALDMLRKMVDAVRADSPAPEGVTVRYMTVGGAPAEQIVAQARAHQADAIVMGTHGRQGLDRFVLGSVAESVVRNAPCSVFTVKPKVNQA